MYQLEIDGEMVGEEYEAEEALIPWVHIALTAGAINAAIWYRVYSTQHMVSTWSIYTPNKDGFKLKGA